MAPTPRSRLIRLLRIVGGCCGAVVMMAALYVLSAWAGSSIPRNREWHEPAQGILVGIETNGVHTSLVMPIATPWKDWRSDFPLADLRSPQRPYTHVSVSWGEREIFLNTATWWDLSPRTVLRVLTVGGQGLTHVSYYVRPAPSQALRFFRVTPDQYRRLIASIEANTPQGPMRRYPGYGSGDVFYESGGKYTPIHTCNQWTSDRLAAAGVRTGQWTPIAGGVMKWAPLH